MINDPTNPLIGIAVAILVGITMLLIKQFLKNLFSSRIDTVYGTLIKAQKELDDHMDECDKIPKSLIIEKIDNLSEKIDKNEQDNKEFRLEMKDELKLQRTRVDILNDTVMKSLLSRGDKNG